MATLSSTLAWKIPWMEEPGRLRSMGSSRTRLRDFTFTLHFHALEKEMTTHSSVLAWRIPGGCSLVGCCLWGSTESDTTEVTQQQQQKGVTRLPRYCSGKGSAGQCHRQTRLGFNPCVGKIPWRRKWQPTPVFVSGEAHGRRSLVGYSTWGCKE